jgi:3',5'-cyclic AMP phosphodiesterase CpdA
VAGTANALAAPPAVPLRRRTLRLAHLTDIHVQSGRGAPEGMAAALRHAQSLEDPPEAILFGGDCIGDALGKPKAEVLEQWDLWNRILDRELRLPAYSCLGNHDIHGWKLRAAQPEVEADPMYGKDFALRRLGMASRHYTFDRGGWRFIVLDSMVYAEGRHGYAARLDEEQYAWLERTLGGTPAAMPVCVLSHIPILSAAVFLDGDLAKSGEWQVPGAWMHLDVARIKTLFHRHPNVRVCLSGHVHLVDDVTYLGVRYLCNGAVSGGWWKGPYQEFGPLYAVIDFHDDGTVERRMEGWGGAPGAGA